jgi:hypothetical protein
MCARLPVAFRYSFQATSQLLTGSVSDVMQDEQVGNINTTRACIFATRCCSRNLWAYGHMVSVLVGCEGIPLSKHTACCSVLCIPSTYLLLSSVPLDQDSLLC